MILFVYDILIYLRSKEEQDTHLKIALQTLHEHCLQEKISRCEFSLTEVVLSRHVVPVAGITIDPAKVEVVLRWEHPTTATKI